MKRVLSANEVIVNYSTWQFIKDMSGFIKSYWRRFVIVTLIRISSDVANLYPPYALAAIITILTRDDITNRATQNRIWLLLGLGITASLYRTITMYVARPLFFKMADKISIKSGLQTINHMMQLDIAWHERENSGNKLKRIQNASDSVNRVLRIWFGNIIEITVNFVGAIFIIATFDRLIAVIMIAFLGVYYMISRILRTRAAKATYEVNVQSEVKQGLEFEIINNIRSAKIMSMVGTLGKRLASQAEKLCVLQAKQIQYFMDRVSSEAIVSQIFKFGILIFIIYLIFNGRLEVGFLFLFNQYFNNISQSISEFSNVQQDFTVARYSVSRMKQVLDEPITIDDEIAKAQFHSDWKLISIKNVSFSYGNNVALKDITFEIKRGEKVGIIGLSGAGKSTLFKLLLKEHENFTGEILIDTVPIQSISKKHYFDHVGVVLQETEVFNFSLRENIALVNENLSDQGSYFKRALQIAHVDEFIKKLQKGADTMIGEKGVRLSGGEKQRLGLARAIFKQPQLLLLDEATSHLDLESEEKIQDSLHQFFKDITAVVIAHRLTTIREMDKILVIEDGEIIESGNYETLYAKQGRFYELWQKQKI